MRLELQTNSGGGPFLAELAAWIVVGAAAACALLDPGLVVLTGPVGRAGRDVLPQLVGMRLRQICPLDAEVVGTP